MRIIGSNQAIKREGAYKKMTELEKVEKLREKTGVSYAEAKEALESSDGNLLDAIIFLEKQGKVNPPPGGGFYSGISVQEEYRQSSDDSRKEQSRNGETFSDLMSRLGRFLLKLFHKGNTNYLEAQKGGEHLFSCPVTALVVLLLFFFWVTVPLLIITLFFGVRYRFSGPDLGRESVNNVMHGASDVVDDVKKSFTDGSKKAGASEE